MRKYILIVFTVVMSISGMAQSSKKAMKKLIKENMEFAAAQYKILAATTADTVMPRSFDADKNQLITSNTKWWCSGFYPGTLWMIYDETRDEAIRTEALKRLKLLEPDKTLYR